MTPLEKARKGLEEMANEKRLIDANALIEEINQQRRASKTSYPKRSYVVGDVLISIYNAPTVDAVEVGSEGSAAGGGRSELSEWPGSADDAGGCTKETAGHPNRTHGRWEWLGPYRYNGDGVIGTCSVCKERLRLFARNYCPNCGAKMDGGNEDA